MVSKQRSRIPPHSKWISQKKCSENIFSRWSISYLQSLQNGKQNGHCAAWDWDVLRVPRCNNKINLFIFLLSFLHEDSYICLSMNFSFFLYIYSVIEIRGSVCEITFLLVFVIALLVVATYGRTHNTISLNLTATNAGDLKLSESAKLTPGDHDATTNPVVGSLGPNIDVTWSNLSPNTKYTMNLVNMLDATDSPLVAVSGSTLEGMYSSNVCTCKQGSQLSVSCFLWKVSMNRMMRNTKSRF